MRRLQKKQCIELIETIKEAHNAILKFLEKNEIQPAYEMLKCCQEAAIAIGNIIELSNGEGTKEIKSIEE